MRYIPHDLSHIFVELNYDKSQTFICVTDRERLFELLYYITATSLGLSGSEKNVSVSVKAEERKGKNYIKILFSPHFIPSDVKNAEREFLGLGADLAKVNAEDLSCEIKIERTTEVASYSLSVTIPV